MVLEYYLPASIDGTHNDVPQELNYTTSFAIKTNPLGNPNMYSFTINIKA